MRMNRGLSGIAVASAVFAMSLACESAAAADPGFYIGAAGGRSQQRLDQQVGVGLLAMASLTAVPGPLPDPLPSLRPVPVWPPVGTPVVIPMQRASTTVDETDIGWNFVLGYRINKYLAAELSYADAGEASLSERFTPSGTPPVSVPDVTYTYTVNARGPAVSVLGTLPLGERWSLFLRGGVFFAKQEVEGRVLIDNPTDTTGTTTRRAARRDFSDEVFNVGGGVQWAFLPRWIARLEYQRSDDLQPNGIMGESRLDQASLSVLFGL